MSTKHFCDVCETEMKPEDHGRIKMMMGNVRIEITHAHGLVWNGGHVCHRCIRDVIAGGETGLYRRCRHWQIHANRLYPGQRQ